MNQPTLFPDPNVVRERITREVARRFACYGDGSKPHHPNNAVGNTLAEQPPQFAFGVKVRDVVDAVLDIAEGAE